MRMGERKKSEKAPFHTEVPLVEGSGVLVKNLPCTAHPRLSKLFRVSSPTGRLVENTALCLTRWGSDSSGPEWGPRLCT